MSHRLYDATRLSPASVVLDIGAHNGVETLEIYERHRCRILAYEPSASVFPELVAATRGTRVQAVRAALADHDGCATFHEFHYPAPYAGEGNSLVARHETEGKELLRAYEVSCRRLETIFADQGLVTVDLLLIDCEGSERAAIRSLTSPALLGRVRQVCVEYHPQIYGAQEHRALVEQMGLHYGTFFDDGIKNVTYFMDGRLESEAPGQRVDAAAAAGRQGR